MMGVAPIYRSLKSKQSMIGVHETYLTTSCSGLVLALIVNPLK